MPASDENKTSEQARCTTVAEIVEALTDFEKLPCEALLAARQRRGEITPVFLDAVDDFIGAAHLGQFRPGPLFLAFHLLGEWRETAAYEPLCRLLRQPIERLELEMGDEFSTESVPHVMAAVCDGNPQPLYDVVLDSEADEFIRWSSFDALVIAVVNGILEREQVTAFLREAPGILMPKEENGVWAGWVEAVERLGVHDLAPKVKYIFETGYLPEGLMEFSDFEEGLKRALASPDGIRPQEHSGEYALFEDAIAELSEWSFARDAGADEDDEYEGPVAFTLPNAPHLNPLRALGRNDPCHCGSGKKFKKCCLNADT